MHCTFAASWPTETKPGRKKRNGESCGGPSGGGGVGGDDGETSHRYVKVARCPLQHSSFGCPNAIACTLADSATVIPIKLFTDVVSLVAKIPVSKNVEAQIAWSWAHSKRIRPTLTSRCDVAAIRSHRTPIRQRAEADELYRSELFHEIMQYVESTLNAAEVVCRIEPARSNPDFRTVLNEWVRATLVPLVREMLPVLSHLSTLFKISTENENAAAAADAAPLPAQATGGASVSAGHQQQVSRRAEFGVYQHLLNRCEKCADDCGDRSLKCDCSAFRCNRCYGLRASDLEGVTGY